MDVLIAVTGLLTAATCDGIDDCVGFVTDAGKAVAVGVNGDPMGDGGTTPGLMADGVRGGTAPFIASEVDPVGVPLLALVGVDTVDPAALRLGVGL